MFDIMQMKDNFPLKHGISRRSYFRGLSEEERDRLRWQLYKPHAKVTSEIEPVYDAASLVETLEALPLTQQRLLEMVAEHLPDPPKPTDKAYPRYDARRLKNPNKLRRSSGMPRNKMYETIQRTEDDLQERERCRLYAIEQGLDYADGKPYTTPKPVNRLAHLLERRPFGGRPTGQTLPVHKTVKSLELGDATLVTKWKPEHREVPTEPGLTPRERDDRMFTDFETQVRVVSELLLPKMLQRGAWSPHHLSVGNVLDVCGKWAKEALLMVYGWRERLSYAKQDVFEVKHPMTKWPSAWLTKGETAETDAARNTYKLAA